MVFRTSHLRSVRLVTTFVVAVLASSASAQSFNVDVGDDPNSSSFGVPSNAYPGAAGQPGFWNSLTDGAAGVNIPPSNTVPWYVATLKDLAGSLTAVSTSVAVNATSNGLGDYEYLNAATTGDDRALYDDLEDIGGVGNSGTWTISNLQNGLYDVYVYAWAPDSSTYITRVSAANTSSTDPQTSGGAWPGGHVLGTTYTLHRVTVNAGTITITVSVVAGFGSVNGFQLVKIDTGTPFCAGDGSATPCPCGNNGSTGNGCANSLNPAGARLSASGNPSIAADSVVLLGSGMPNSSCLYFQGTAQQNGGLGSVFGDGLRCAGGQVIRLGTKTNSGGASQYPAAGDPSVSVRGLDAPGNVRTYQAWYRNAAAFCNPETFNLSNGLSITWLP